MVNKVKKIPKRVVAGRKKLTASMSRYRLKPGHSEKLRLKSRKQYRKAKGKDFELEGSTVLRVEDFLDEEAMVLPVYNEETDRIEHLSVLRPTHVAKLLNVTYQTFWRWTTETRQVPQPILKDSSQGREYAVFHVDEVRAMIRIIGKHLTEYRYYRKDHAATRQRLFTAIEATRAEGFTNQLNEGNTHHGNRTQRQGTGGKKQNNGKGRARKRNR